MSLLYPEFIRVTDMFTDRYMEKMHRHYIYRDADSQLFCVGCVILKPSGQREFKFPERQYRHPHEANAEFESNLFQDEQVGMEPIDDREDLTFAALDSGDINQVHPIMSHYDDMVDALRDNADGWVSQKLHSGIRVFVVCTPKMEIKLYPAGFVGLDDFEIPARTKTLHYIEKAFLPFNSAQSGVLEGYYSDSLGLTITDIVFLNDKNTQKASISERQAVLSGLFVGQSKVAFCDHVELFAGVCWRTTASSAWENPNAPVYLLRNRETKETILISADVNKTMSFSSKGSGLGEYMELAKDFLTHPAPSPTKQFRVSHQLCSAAGFFPFSKREPILLFR
jgi:hypothetical protein